MAAGVMCLSFCKKRMFACLLCRYRLFVACPVIGLSSPPLFLFCLFGFCGGGWFLSGRRKWLLLCYVVMFWQAEVGSCAWLHSVIVERCVKGLGVRL